jgi:hypothetical protein
MTETGNPLSPQEQFQLMIRLESIFMPVARRQRDAHYDGGKNPTARFVHYTSAEAALSIINSKRIWLRNTTCMADYREVQHGYDMLHQFFADASNKANFFDTLNGIVPGIATEAVNLFDQWWTNIRFSTYIASVSEHDDKEDFHGRLSMWRAFGNNPSRVAIVFRVPWFTGVETELNIIFSPVAYLRPDEAHKVIKDVLQNAKREAAFLKEVDRGMLVTIIFNTLLAGVTCSKHEGFHEEREWRAIYTPQRSPSSLIESSTQVIGGVPQIIHHLPLDKAKTENLAPLDLTNMLDRLIIGPSQFAWPMYEAFLEALTDQGVEDAAKHIFISGIPIRS